MKYADMTPEQKRARIKQNQNAVQRYNAANYDKIALRIRRDGGDGFTPEQLRRAAAAEGMSLNAWIVDAIRDKI